MEKQDRRDLNTKWPLYRATGDTSAQDHGVVTGLKASPDKSVWCVSQHTLLRLPEAGKKKATVLFFFLNGCLLRMFKGFLLAYHQLYIVLSFFLYQIIFFFREVILLMSRKGHSDNIKNPQNHSSPSVFKASCQMLCLSMVSASLLTAYKVLPSQHLEASSAWYIMESLQAETGIEEARGIVNSQYEQLPIQIVTNTSLSFLNIAESSAFRLGVWTTTNRRKG